MKFITKSSSEYKKTGKYDEFHHSNPDIFSSELKNILDSIEVELCGETASYIDFIKHDKDCYENKEDVPKIIQLLCAGFGLSGIDGIDSGLDKGGKKKQHQNKTFIASAYGYEEKKLETTKISKDSEKIEEIIIKLFQEYKSIKNNMEVVALRNKLLEYLKPYYSNLLGETRRSANDVSLWDHSYSVASLFKSVCAKNFLDCSKVSFCFLDFKCKWKIFSVNLNIPQLLTRGNKLGDIVGYKEIIKDVFKKVKSFIEVNYPVGNEIYKDTTGIYFLIPKLGDKIEIEIKDELDKQVGEFSLMIDINFWDGENNKNATQEEGEEQDKEDKIKNVLKSILTEARNKSIKKISFPISSKKFKLSNFNNNWNNKEICPICQLRPMEEHGDGCSHCLERRVRRAKRWLDNQNTINTIWLDEISDHNNQIAIIIGTFTLDKWLDGTFVKTLTLDKKISKNPSPARIRRCWETTENFIKEIVFKKIIKSGYQQNLLTSVRNQRICFKIVPNPGIIRGATLDISIGGHRLSPVCINQEKGTFLTTINLEILDLGTDVEQVISRLNKLKDKPIKIKRTQNSIKNYFITEIKKADNNLQKYIPFSKIYDYPNQFMTIVPAFDAFKIAKKIYQEYKIQFSKVRDRLPFHLGIIGFHRKLPLHIAMEAANKLLRKFQMNKKIQAKVKEIRSVKGERFGNRAKELTFDAEEYSDNLRWNISYSTGDPSIKDEWYPYFRSEGCNSDKNSFSFTDNNGNYFIYLNELRCDNLVYIDPSYFKLAYINSAQDRFTINENLKPIDAIDRYNLLWDIFYKKLERNDWTLSQIYSFWELVEKKLKNYDNLNIKKEFLGNIMKNILVLEQETQEWKIIFQSILEDNIFHDYLFWNLKIRKKIGSRTK
jgi:hypothetical protein